MNILARARAILGLTQEEMADALGVSRSTYQRREALADEYVPLAERTLARTRVLEAADAALLGFEVHWVEPTPREARIVIHSSERRERTT